MMAKVILDEQNIRQGPSFQRHDILTKKRQPSDWEKIIANEATKD